MCKAMLIDGPRRPACPPFASLFFSLAISSLPCPASTPLCVYFTPFLLACPPSSLSLKCQLDKKNDCWKDGQRTYARPISPPPKKHLNLCALRHFVAALLGLQGKLDHVQTLGKRLRQIHVHFFHHLFLKSARRRYKQYERERGEDGSGHICR